MFAPEMEPLQRSRELGPRIEALRAEATAVRTANWSTHTTRDTELGIELDRLALERAGLEQAAAEAGRQAAKLDKIAAAKAEEVRFGEQHVAELERAGRSDDAEIYRRALLQARSTRDSTRARADQAELNAAERHEQLTAMDRRIGDNWTAQGEAQSQFDRIGGEIGKLEQQAELLEQVRLKWSEIAVEPDNIPRRAELELELEALSRQAEAIAVDRDVLRTVVPELPETAPVAQQPELDDTVATPDLGATDTDVLGAGTFASSVDAEPAPPRQDEALTEDAPSTPQPETPEAEAPVLASFDELAPVDEPATFEELAMDQDVTFEEPVESDVAVA